MVVWKVSKGRADTLHAYDLPFSWKRGVVLHSLCRKRDFRILTPNNDEGVRCKICVRRASEQRTSGGLDVC